MSTFSVMHSSNLQTSSPCVSGMFGTAVSGRPGVALSHEQGESSSTPPADPSAGICSHALPGSHIDSDDSPRPDELKVSHTLSSDKTQRAIKSFPAITAPAGVFTFAGEGEERQGRPGQNAAAASGPAGGPSQSRGHHTRQDSPCQTDAV